MLTEDLQPWLIEINSSPSMEASTAVTARLCKNVLDDTIKGRIPSFFCLLLSLILHSLEVTI